AQLNPTVGDLTGNADLIVDAVRQAAAAGAHVVVCSEMAPTGYPREDLALRQTFTAAARQALTDLATRLAAQAPRDGPAVGGELTVLRFHGVDIGMVICEDLGQDGGPIAALGEAGVDVIVSPNASPYERNKDDVRIELAGRRAAEAGAPLVYCNQVGGQDDLVFDGGSFIVDPSGTALATAEQFVSKVLVADLELTAGTGHRSGTFAGVNVQRKVLMDEPLPAYEKITNPQVQPLSDEAE